MNIDTKLDNGCLTLKVEGRLDTNTSPDLSEAMTLDGVTEIVFDFAGLEYISSAGLRVLMTAHKAMMACGGKNKGSKIFYKRNCFCSFRWKAGRNFLAYIINAL